ncbi:uncharacterized protein LOC111314315 [Durio zibethinus]|uniref:Uncharacterized protein LOC111314315 n=1 Tax=Durio zibethinus TaxID=66656 RepID=A0A6P6B2L2_DURZI|nr:uncharacterized protein LOC111314315 [Durio zibethinus]
MKLPDREHESCNKCISLPPAKKAWKSFTSKLQTRLHKLHKSKAIKKPKNNRLQTAASKTTRPSLFLGQRLQRNRRRRGLPFYVSKNKAAPVYIDKLFKEAPITELVGYYNPQQPSEKSDTVEREKNVKFIDQAAAAGAEAGTSKDGEKQGDEKSSVGDDMWESIGLASPILHGIDARAEEFIASFRAEMERQEIMARSAY